MNILYAMNRKHFNVWFDNKSVWYIAEIIIIFLSCKEQDNLILKSE